MGGTSLDKQRQAYYELEGVGDATRGEWTEWTTRAIHLRRRLSEEEDVHVGPVKDIRGTDEAAVRLYEVRKWLPPGYTE